KEGLDPVRSSLDTLVTGRESKRLPIKKCAGVSGEGSEGSS
ncbi:hypothetical protein TNCT_235241, partial [Trichonephila clavata]